MRDIRIRPSKPIVLVACKDTDHAKKIRALIDSDDSLLDFAITASGVKSFAEVSNASKGTSQPEHRPRNLSEAYRSNRRLSMTQACRRLFFALSVSSRRCQGS